MKTFYATQRSYMTSATAEVGNPEFYEVNNEPSKTIPGEAYTIEQMLKRYQTHGELSMSQVPYLDAKLDEINEYYSSANVDLVDLERLQARIDAIQEQIRLDMMDHAKPKSESEPAKTEITKTEPSKEE